MRFIDKLIGSLEKKGTYVCVGLDSRYDRIPEIYKKNTSISQAIYSFNKDVIASTHDVAVMFKMNVSFYAGFGAEGLEGLRLTNEYLKGHFPEIPIISDCKRSEMGESVKMVKQEMYDWLQFDCIMVTPWFGFDTVRDYLEDETHGVCVYIHDSNPTATEFQELEGKNGKMVYEVVAERISHAWNTNGNVFAETAATYPVALKKVRQIIGDDMPLLVAGIGAQGGTADVLKGVFGTNTKRLIVNSSRGIIFAGEGKTNYMEAVHDAAHGLASTLQDIATS